MPHESGELRPTNASGTLESTLENTRAGAASIRRSGGIFASTQLAAEIEALRCHASEAGLFRDFGWLSLPPDAFGYEHQVWFPQQGGTEERVLKATYANTFGVLPDGSNAGPVAYLERLILQNQILGDDIRLEGLVEPGIGTLRLITSQPAIEGRPASEEEIVRFFCSNGFELMKVGQRPVWYRSKDEMLCSDTHGGNILVTASGDMVAIDVPVMRKPPEMSLSALQVT